MVVARAVNSNAAFRWATLAVLVGAVALNAGAALAPYVADEATLHLWHLDEPAPPCVDATPGGTNLLTLSGGATLNAASWPGFGASLVTVDGGPDQAGGTNSDAALTALGVNNPVVIPYCDAATGAFTCEALVHVEFDPARDFASRNAPFQILNADGNSGAQRIFQFRVDPIGFPAFNGDTSSNAVRLEFINLGGTVQNILTPLPTSGPDAIRSNEWFHVAVTYDGSPGVPGNIKFYWTLLDANRTRASLLDGAKTMNANLPGASNATVFTIGNAGRNPGGNAASPLNGNFVGRLDEVRLSRVVRAANEFVFQAASPLAASSFQNVTGDYHPPQDAMDGDLTTRWSAQGDGQWISFDLGRVVLVQSLDAAFYQGNTRTSTFDVQLSNDNAVWRTVLTNQVSSGLTTNLESFDLPDYPARYVRIVGHGNSTGNGWNSLTEVAVHSGALSDSDGDALPDFWENFYFGNLNGSGSQDPDSDQQSNAYEFLHGTDPTRYNAPGDTDNDGLPDVWEQQWFGSLSPTGADDPDADGYANLQEYAAGSDPTDWNSIPGDVDGDTQPDDWEWAQLDGLTFGAYDDPDHDGYDNVAERLAGTDPLAAASHPGWTSPRVAFLRDSVVATNACLMPATATYGRAINGISFQDQILLTFAGYQYTAWYDTEGTNQFVWLARRAVTNTVVGAWEKCRTDAELLNGDEPAWDAHDVIALGICPGDGTLHLAWDMHGQPLKYRRSVPGLCTTNRAAWGAGMLEAAPSRLSAADPVNYDASVTYPQFVTTPDGQLFLDRRYGASGDGDDLLQHYDPVTGGWSTNTLFIARTGTYGTSTSRNAYLNGLDFGPDGRLHVTWTWREGAGSANHDLCYAYSTDAGATWRNNAGTLIADARLGQSINLDTPGIVFRPLDGHQLLINQQAQCVDSDGRLHVLVLHRRQDAGFAYPNFTAANFSTLATAYYHYFRDPTTGEWSQRRLPVEAYPVGSRPKIACDAHGNVYATYLSYPAGTDVVPGYNNGRLVIASASRTAQYTDWQVVQALTVDLNGEPLIDSARLLADSILSVYIQENSAATTVVGTPLHVFDFAVGVTPPEPLSLNFVGNDSLVVLNGLSGHTYQLQAADGLEPGSWSDAGPWVNGLNGLLALPDPDGRQASHRFYRVLIDP